MVLESAPAIGTSSYLPGTGAAGLPGLKVGTIRDKDGGIGCARRGRSATGVPVPSMRYCPVRAAAYTALTQAIP